EKRTRQPGARFEIWEIEISKVEIRTPRLQVQGKEDGVSFQAAAEGFAAAFASVSRRICSFCSSSDVLRTTPPASLISFSTLSAVICLISTNRTASPGFTVAVSSFMN